MGEKDNNIDNDAVFKIISIISWMVLFPILLFFINDKYIEKILGETVLQFIQNNIFYIVIPIILVIVVLFCLEKTRKWIGSILLFPISFIGLIIWKLISTIAKIIFGKSKLLKSTAYYITSFALLLSSTIVILIVKNEIIVSIAMFALFILLALHYLQKPHSLYKPVQWLNKIKEFFEKHWAKFILKIRTSFLEKKKSNISNNAESIERHKKEISFLWFINRTLYRLGSFLKNSENNIFIVTIFIFSILDTIFFTISVFGLEYLALSNIQHNSFTKIANYETIDYFLYSFSVLTSSSIVELAPQTITAKLMVTSQVFCGLLILVFLFFIYSNIVIEKYKEDKKIIIQQFDSAAKSIENYIKAEYNDEVYNLIPSLLEGFKKDGLFYKFLKLDDEEKQIKLDLL